MCGICGVVNTDGAPVSASVLRAMSDTLRHRGPEAAGVYIDATVPGVGLGHTRLRILDLREVADQPMATDDGPFPTATLSSTSFVSGLMRATVPSSLFATQTASSSAATSSGS